MPEGRGLFEVAREKIRTRHLAFRTEQAYLHWMRRYVKFHGGSCSRRAATLFAIALRRIYSRPATTAAPCRNCWDTPM